MAAQALRQVSVKFNHRQGTQALDQGLRQSRQARANFNHGVPNFRGNGVHN